MKVIIAGGRDITNIACVRGAVDRSGFALSEIVSGGCRGVDALGEQYGKEAGIGVRIFPADWALGPKAGPIRNRQMAEYADALIAVWNGKSPGTRSMIREAKKRGLPVYVHKVAP